jgi:RNA polymerase sigma-70 factor, ECF subfamily
MSGFKQDLVALLPRLRRFALTMTNSLPDAEDLVQSGVERALRHEQSWQPGTRLDSWMFKMIQNLWLDERRAYRRRAEPLDNFLDLPGEDGREALLAPVRLAEVRAIVQSLPAEQRAVLALVVLDGMSYRHAAETLDIPIGTVMSRVARARVAIAKRLESAEERVRVIKSGK